LQSKSQKNLSAGQATKECLSVRAWVETECLSVRAWPVQTRPCPLALRQGVDLEMGIVETIVTLWYASSRRVNCNYTLPVDCSLECQQCPRVTLKSVNIHFCKGDSDVRQDWLLRRVPRCTVATRVKVHSFMTLATGVKIHPSLQSFASHARSFASCQRFFVFCKKNWDSAATCYQLLQRMLGEMLGLTEQGFDSRRKETIERGRHALNASSCACLC